MKDFTNNDVAKHLEELAAKKAKREREHYYQQLEKLKEPRQVIIETALPVWKGPPTATTSGPLYDLEFMKVVSLWTHYGTQGQAANVTVIDTGVDPNHPAFAHTEFFQKSFIQNDPTANDLNGHGTWVCGKIVGQGVGIAPKCNLTCFRTMDANGSGTVDASIAALQEVLKDGSTNLVNMSLGSPVYSAAQEKVINQLAAAGVLVVAAAGNYGTDIPFYPGSYDNTLAVAATDKTSTRASFSDYGGQVDIAAPGVACYSTYLGGQFRLLSGTSMASPIVTGLLALGVSYLKMVKNISDRKVITAKLLQALEATATDLGTAGKDPYYGFGIINGLEFMKRLSA